MGTLDKKNQVNELIENAVMHALKEIDLGEDELQRLTENGPEFQVDIIALLKKHTKNRRFIDEEIRSDIRYGCCYQDTPKTISKQVDILRRGFPNIGLADKELARQPLPPGAEGWFAIPRWEKIAPTYSEAVEKVIALLKKQRGRGKLYIHCEINEKSLYQNKQTEKQFEILGNTQESYDILVVAAQFGLRHRGRSARRAWAMFLPTEFGLGAFEVGCMLLTHPERIANPNALDVYCVGSEYESEDEGNSILTFSALEDYDNTRKIYRVFTEYSVDTAYENSAPVTGFLPE